MTSKVNWIESWSKAIAVFDRYEKGFYHFGGNEVAFRLVQLIYPKVKPGKVAVRRIIRISPQVAEILHLDKAAIHFTLREGNLLRDDK